MNTRAVSGARAGTALVALARQSGAGLRMLIGFTLLLGLAYPLAVFGVGQVAFPWQANGSLVRADGSHATSVDTAGSNPVIGSELIGQSFGAAGKDPQWFHSRPSASNYDTLASGASNLGPNSPTLVREINQRRGALAAADGVSASAVPPDALTASASGLDPDISPAYAYEQVDRVAAARGLPASQVRALVAQSVEGRPLGVLGEPRVNVLKLNLALEQAS